MCSDEMELFSGDTSQGSPLAWQPLTLSNVTSLLHLNVTLNSNKSIFFGQIKRTTFRKTVTMRSIKLFN